MAGPTAPDEQGVREAVEVTYGFRRDLFDTAKSDALALRAAADGTADVEVGVEAAAAGEEEGAEGLEVFVEAVHFGLEAVDFGMGDAGLFGMDVLGQGSEHGAEIEELVLDAEEDGGEIGEAGIRGGDARSTEKGVQFVYGAVGGDAGTFFGDALASGEGSLAGVALAGVDAVDGEAGLFEGIVGHRRLCSVYTGEEKADSPPRRISAQWGSRAVRSRNTGGSASSSTTAASVPAPKLEAKAEPKPESKKEAKTEPKPGMAAAAKPELNAEAGKRTAAAEPAGAAKAKPAGTRTAAGLHAQARQLLSDGKFAEAVEHLTAEDSRGPAYALAYNGRGFAQYRLKTYKEASADFDEAIRLNPT